MAKSTKKSKKPAVKSAVSSKTPRARVAKKTEKKTEEKTGNRAVALLSGALALSLGVFTLMTNISSIPALSVVIGIGLLILGIFELIGLLSSKRSAAEFTFSLMHSAPIIVIAILMLGNYDKNMAWSLILLAIFAIGRGVVEILTAFATLEDKLDRFIWLVCGAIGVILGIVVLNSGNFADQTAFLRFFSTYLMVYGVSLLTYSVHSHKTVL